MGIVSFAPKILTYGKRVAKVLPEAVFGNGAEVAGKAMREAKGSMLTKAKAGFVGLENDIITKQATEGKFLKRITSNLGEITRLPKAEYAAAKAAGKSGILAGAKGFFKGIGKNMPFIGAAMTLLFEIPNIVTATKEQGIGQGIAETVKAGARLIGGAAGAAIGSAICPGIGTMVGWVAGEWLTSKIVGKSYTEKKDEALEEAQTLTEAQNQTQMQQQDYTQMQTPNFNGNPYNTNPMYAYNSGLDNYADDIMMQQLNFNTIA